jgi:hypothetical protein
MSFALTGVVKAAKGKKRMVEVLKESVTESKNVVIGFLLISVPLLVIGVAAIYFLLGADINTLQMMMMPLGVAVLSLVLTVLMFLLLGFGFIPQTAVLEKKGNAIDALKKSLGFSKKHFAGVFSLYALILASVIVIQIVVMVLEVIASLAVDITAFTPGIEFALSVVLITLAVSAQTHYYTGMK